MAEAFLLGIGGGGTSADLQTKSVNLNLANGDQVISPDTGYDGMTSVTVIRPATAVPENIKKDANIGGIIGTYEGEAIPNALDGLVDGTITTFTMPQGKTTVHRYLFYSNLSLTSANLQGATTIEPYAFDGCLNAEITLPSTLTNIGQYAFQNASRASSVSAMELVCQNAFCTLNQYAFYAAKIAKVIGKFTKIGTNAFTSAMNLAEVDVEVGQDGILDSAFSGNVSITKMHLKLNNCGLFTNCFNYCANVSDFLIQGSVTAISVNTFNSFGINRVNPANNRFSFDFSSSTFTSIGNSAFYEVDYSDFFIPVSCSSIMSSVFQNGRNNNIYFLSSTPATIQSNSFNGIYQTTIWVPYNSANAYRTKTNWTTSASVIQGFSAENTFQNGDTLPEYNDEGYGLTWYSDEARTTQVTTVSDATQKYWCTVGTTKLVYRIKSVTTMDCTITITDGTNTYAVNDQVLVGTSLTITSSYTDSTKTQVYMFDINGTDYKPSTSETITVASDITVLCLYYDGINAPVDPVLANNSWQQVLIGCQNGLAGTLWQVGDTKTDSAGFVWKIVDLKNSRYARADGTGYTNCAFMMDPRCFDETTNWRTSSNSENYSQSLVNTKLSTDGVFYNQIDQTLAALVDQNKIVVKASQASSSATVDCTVGFFAPCYTEMGYTGSYNYATNAETVCNGVTMGAFEYFASNTSSLRIRKDSTNTARTYWLRSRNGSTYAVRVLANGSYDAHDVYISNRVCPCFAF